MDDDREGEDEIRKHREGERVEKGETEKPVRRERQKQYREEEESDDDEDRSYKDKEEEEEGK